MQTRGCAASSIPCSRFRAALICAALCLPSASLPQFATAAQKCVDATASAASATWAIRAGDTRLDVEVRGVCDPARLRLLRRWLDEATNAARLPSGRFPLAHARVIVREIESRSRSPVPWGQTRRDDEVAVLLFVRRGAGIDALSADWTAVHEFAHLAHPYLGDEGRWLAEGLASYQQNVLRARGGLLDADEAWRRLDAGFRRGEAVGEGPPIEALGRSGTMRTYWAGAMYWLEADLALRRSHGLSLQQVLERYARCCLDGTDWLSPTDFVRALDRAAGVEVFEALYRRHRNLRAMPSPEAAYDMLGLTREDGSLRFGGDARARALRAAVMRAD